MSHSKSQTATEYLIILGVVVVIAVITVGTVSDVISLGSDFDGKTFLLEMQTKDISLNEYVILQTNSSFQVQNNLPNLVNINGIWVDKRPCASTELLPIRLGSTKEKIITCMNIFGNSQEINEFVIEYTVIKTNSSFFDGIENGNFKKTTDVNCWGDQTNGYYDICTCNDLNQTREQLSRDYALRYNIDFAESHCSQYRLGEGWLPIGNESNEYIGHFNGYEHTISNLYINRPSSTKVALFGDLYTASQSGNISNLGVLHANIIGGQDSGILGGHAINSQVHNVYTTGTLLGTHIAGGILANAANLNMTNSFFIGKVTSLTNGYIGGIVGFGNGADIYHSFSIAEVTGANNHVGGILGYGSGSPHLYNVSSFGIVSAPDELFVGGLSGYISGLPQITNSYSSATVRGNGFVGGLTGSAHSGVITNSSTTSKIFCATSNCGGLSGYLTAGSCSGVNEWTDHSDDNATSCTGTGTCTGCVTN